MTRSHSRPHVSDDNPYSEAEFKTLKYLPNFPGKFVSLEEARKFCAEFFYGYNHHSQRALGKLTPAEFETIHATADAA